MRQKQDSGWGGAGDWGSRTTGQTSCFFFRSYKYTWKLEEARKNLLRTHTTSASARILYSLAQKVQLGLGRVGGWYCPVDLLTCARAGPDLLVTYPPQKPFTPAKYFSIDRVFRNETLDATHLAEFHQIEGVIADHGLTLGHLMGVLREFFSKLGEQASHSRQEVFGVPERGLQVNSLPCLTPTGITQLRFKPAYNPYTEPSMEVFSYHQGQGWETGYRGSSEGPHIWPG